MLSSVSVSEILKFDPRPGIFTCAHCTVKSVAGLENMPYPSHFSFDCIDSLGHLAGLIHLNISPQLKELGMRMLRSCWREARCPELPQWGRGSHRRHHQLGRPPHLFPTIAVVVWGKEYGMPMGLTLFIRPFAVS